MLKHKQGYMHERSKVLFIMAKKQNGGHNVKFTGEMFLLLDFQMR